MLVESLRVPPKIRRMRIAMLLAALTLSGTAATANAGPAHADNNIPWDGALCQAMENIQFYNIRHEPSYTVQRGELIRVDDFMGYHEVWAQGHGEGHSSRWFYWRHSNGAFRVEHCR
ncbi:hypothetical protein [Micromonospora sp. CPCC 205561]|uniref:hypothetical protein n=1 Tax=Micromonospora sp. CPCC 205561 TaxID=3122407 RepID=UPI002FF37FA5